MANKQADNSLTIRILGRDYSVACPEGERESLLRSAEYLSKRMQAIQKRGKTLGIDKVAVMAALNISHDLLELEKHTGAQQAESSEADEAVRERLSQMEMRIDESLDDTAQQS
ncbi:cell division protein ZapA [Salinisphaera sp. USBA-960]|nr:cell division protein ZapA [Salifodinibacter halophilus]NNC26973.1 cell division protein ZapA [Salifodinibacter halophilus]